MSFSIRKIGMLEMPKIAMLSTLMIDMCSKGAYTIRAERLHGLSAVDFEKLFFTCNRWHFYLFEI